MPVRPIKKHGKTVGYQADHYDASRNPKRVKRNFPAGRTGKKQAEEWLAAIIDEQHNRLLGKRERQIFGPALAKYLKEESPKKRTHQDDKYNLTALRWPFWDSRRRRWIRLEECYIDDSPEGIIAMLSSWVADMRLIQKRSYINRENYHLRPGSDGNPTWYRQPDPREGTETKPREEVTDKKLIARLNKLEGRGPFAGSTLRTRQLLVRRVLYVAWKKWRILDNDISGLIELEKQAAPREFPYSYDLLLRLIIHAPIGLDEAILLATWTGWRRSNILGRKESIKGRAIEPLTWSRVIFPVWKDHGTHKELIEMGTLWYEGDASKNEEPHYHPMSERVEQLLKIKWDQRDGDIVFHKNGQLYPDFKRAWKTVKAKAGAPKGMRWHDLRHMFGGMMAEAGATEGDLMELGNWKDPKMPKIYASRRKQHLLDVMERAAKVQR